MQHAFLWFGDYTWFALSSILSHIFSHEHASLLQWWPLSPTTNTTRSRLFKQQSQGAALGEVTRVLFSEDCFSRKDLASDLYFPGKEVGPIQLVVLAELGEDFRGLGRVSPGVVSFSAKWREDREWGGLASPGGSHSMSLFKRPPHIGVVSFRFNLPF